MRKIIPYLVVAVFSCAYAQDAELLIVDDFTGGANEELLEADQSENGSEVVEVDIEGDIVGTQSVPGSGKKMHFGGRVRLGAAALFEDAVFKYYKFGVAGGAGFAFNYFFYKKLAFLTGLDFRVLVLRNFLPIKKKMYNVNSGQTYGWRSGFEVHDVINYTLSYFGVSLPLALRVGDRFWAEFGFLFDYMAGWTDYEIPPEIESYTRDLRDPFKLKTTLYPNFLVGGGINMPMGKWSLDLGLQASICLSDIETDYQTTQFPLFSIGIAIAFWR